MTSAQLLVLLCRNRRIVAFHGLSSRSNIHRQSGFEPRCERFFGQWKCSPAVSILLPTRFSRHGRRKNISKKSAKFQKHVQFFHLSAIDIEDVDFSMPIRPLSRLSMNGDKMADRCFFECGPRLTVTKPRATPSKTGVLSPWHQGYICNRSFMMAIPPSTAQLSSALLSRPAGGGGCGWDIFGQTVALVVDIPQFLVSTPSLSDITQLRSASRNFATFAPSR
jgi:hypothetical protein